MGCHVCKSTNTVSSNLNSHVNHLNTDLITPKKSLYSRRATSLSYQTGGYYSNSIHVSANHFIKFKQQPILQDYTFSRQSTGNGLIKAIQKETCNIRSVKVLPKARDTPITQITSNTEIQILQLADHPNIVQLHECYIEESQIYLVLTYCSGVTLQQYVQDNGPLSEQQAANIFRQIISAVSHCHNMEITHRILKPSNIMIETNGLDIIVKLASFTCIENDSELYRVDLSEPFCLAPEGFKRRFDQKSDIWSCGVILYYMITRQSPFDGRGEDEILMKTLKAKLTFELPIFKQSSYELVGLINSILQVKQNKRPKAEEILAHPWLIKNPSLFFDNPKSTILLRNLVKHTRAKKFQEAVLAFISNHLHNFENQSQLARLFRGIDNDKDGRLCLEDLVTHYSRNMPYKEALDLSISVMEEADSDKSGFIEFSEFLMAVIKKETLLANDYLVHTFKLFDQDQNGFVTKQDVIDLLEFDESELDEEQWNELFVDFGENEMLDFEQFKTIMLKSEIGNN